MLAHPLLVAGEGRACTELMEAMDGGVAVKTGAEAVYVAILPARGLGVALKIEDGATRASECAIAAHPGPARRARRRRTRRPAAGSTRRSSAAAAPSPARSAPTRLLRRRRTASDARVAGGGGAAGRDARPPPASDREGVRLAPLGRCEPRAPIADFTANDERLATR